MMMLVMLMIYDESDDADDHPCHDDCHLPDGAVELCIRYGVRVMTPMMLRPRR